MSARKVQKMKVVVARSGPLCLRASGGSSAFRRARLALRNRAPRPSVEKNLPFSELRPGGAPSVPRWGCVRPRWAHRRVGRQLSCSRVGGSEEPQKLETGPAVDGSGHVVDVGKEDGSTPLATPNASSLSDSDPDPTTSDVVAGGNSPRRSPPKTRCLSHARLP